MPNWLADEDALRDEAVLFGLSEARAEEKLATIRYHFVQCTSDWQQTIDGCTEQLGEINLLISQAENRLGEVQHQLDELAHKPLAEHQFPRTLVGLSIALLMSTGTYFLIDETLSPRFPNNRWIAAGVFLAGMFSQFNQSSTPSSPISSFSIRQWPERVGLPLTASLFVFVQALSTQSIPSALALLSFLFFLFMFAGKSLPQALLLLRTDWRAYHQNRRFSRDAQAKTVAGKAEVSQLHQHIDQLRVQKWQIIPELNRAEATLNRLQAQRDRLIKLFESEFNLARSLRDQLTSEQQQSLSGY